MRIVTSHFISLDGVVQAPGGAEEDTDGGFAHGGWSMPYFDTATMGAADLMNSIPKYVASRTLSQDDLFWTNSTLLGPDDAPDDGRSRPMELASSTTSNTGVLVCKYRYLRP
jgi:hypothetical protein